MSSVKDLLRGDVVDGSGTANYVSKWSDADTITNSVIYDDGTNVGIGTSSPSAKLHVNAGSVSTPRGSGFTKFFFTGDSTNTTYLELQTPSNSSGDILFSDGSGGAYGLLGYDHNTDSMRFYTNSGERIRIDSTGNVGVGTSSPDSKLHLFTNGTTATVLRIEDTQGQAGIRLMAGDASVNRATRIDFLDKKSSTTLPKWTFINDYNQNGTNDFRIVKEDLVSPVLTLLQSGNVGIGTTAPGAKLTVVGGIQSAATAVGTPDALGLPGGGETRYYYFTTSTSFQNFLSVPGTNATFLMVYRIGQSDLTSVPNGMVMIFSAPGVGYTVISGSSSYLNVSGSTVQIRSNYGSYGTGVWMMLTRIA